MFIYIYIYINIYIYIQQLLDKNIRPPSKMKKRYIVYNFLIMKIKYMIDNFKRHFN